MHNYKALKVWNASRELCKNLYLVTNSFPSFEKFGIIIQIRKAAVSVPSNIAEGASRSSKKEYARFLEISIGSLYELETQLLISSDLSYIDQIQVDQLISQIDEIIRMAVKFRARFLEQ